MARGGLVRVLLAAGADANATRNDGDSALLEAISNDHSEVVQALLSAGRGVTPSAMTVVRPCSWRALMAPSELYAICWPRAPMVLGGRTERQPC